ncbi:hypothetical protein NEDG_01181 [Nematocida displodere]|uniref:Uncharacterized protein n=1 Tax=Nematocida displodere TaxID=1805483 RepID=A0A177ED02_9MICR|nr:hypothetical protein NEDG_01181 [Nematocida displodere]
MLRYKVVGILDIGQPLLTYDESKVPSILKAVVKTEKGLQIVYLEVDQAPFGKGTVFVATEGAIIKMSQARVEKRGEYGADRGMIKDLLQKAKTKRDRSSSKT